MRNRQRTRSSGGGALTGAAVLFLALVLVMLPNQALAAVNCATVLTETGVDSDGDGFTDYQECTGITLADGVTFVPPCPSPLGRSACLDPNTKDLFVIYAPFLPVPPDIRTSLLPAGFNPFGTVTYYGATFNGLTALGITAHQITPGQAYPDRTVTSGSTQHAIMVAESLDTNGTVLGYCQWGTPNGLDGCTVYTQRTLNFITSTCGTNTIVSPTTTTCNGFTCTANDVLLAYTVHTFLHEVGHTTGGMTAIYNSSYGGYHYKCGAGTMMEQCVTYSTKGGKCSFNVSTGWNTTTNPTDSSTIKLK